MGGRNFASEISKTLASCPVEGVGNKETVLRVFKPTPGGWDEANTCANRNIGCACRSKLAESNPFSRRRRPRFEESTTFVHIERFQGNSNQALRVQGQSRVVGRLGYVVHRLQG